MADETSDPYPVGSSVQSLDSLTRSQIEAYWHKVCETLKRVFHRNDAESMVDQLRQRLEGVNPETQLYFFHRDPFQVASDLCEFRAAPTTVSQKRAYLAVLQELEDVYDYPDDMTLNRQVPEDLATDMTSGAAMPPAAASRTSARFRS